MAGKYLAYMFANSENKRQAKFIKICIQSNAVSSKESYNSGICKERLCFRFCHITKLHLPAILKRKEYVPKVTHDYLL
jgi:hypothetical protein